MKACPQPDCPHGQPCPDHRRKPDTRPSAGARGYGRRWSTKIRPAYLKAHPWCCLCGAPATTPDHHPLTRRQLLAQGVTNPDHPRHLRPLCDRCHRTETVKHDGGLGRQVTPADQR